MKTISLGNLHLAEFYGCCVQSINSVELVRKTMVEAATIAQATIVTDVFHEFNPHGISGVVVIAESHFAIHSWPEHGCVSVDLFTCSHDMNPKTAIDYLASMFKAKKVTVQSITRGEALNTPQKLALREL